MSGNEAVVFAFRRIGESTETVQFADGVENVASSREYLMSVGLMSDVPDDAVIGGVKNVV